MPIVGVTDRKTRLPEAGKLRKGAKKPASGNRPGADLNGSFRFTSQEPYFEALFEAEYGLEPTSLEVYLPGRTPAECFSAWLEEWDSGNRLVFRGDGETLVKWMDDKKAGTYSYQRKPHPRGEDGAPLGSFKGRLRVLLPGLRTLRPVTVTTGSFNDILRIQAALVEVYEDSKSGGDLSLIPFVLSRVKVEISRPGKEKGTKTRGTSWLLSLEPAPQYVAARFEALRDMKPILAPPDNHDLAESSGGNPLLQEEPFGEDFGLEADEDWEELEDAKPLPTAEETKAALVVASMDGDDAGNPAPLAVTRKLRTALGKAAGGDVKVAGQALQYLFAAKSTELTNGQAQALLGWLGAGDRSAEVMGLSAAYNDAN